MTSGWEITIVCSADFCGVTWIVNSATSQYVCSCGVMLIKNGKILAAGSTTKNF